MINKILNPLTTFIIGLLLGIFSRLFDLYTQNLGNIFSQFAIRILLGTLISIYSKSAKMAMLNILLFCTGMLLTYYAATLLTEGIYGHVFIIGWTIFALCSPIMAYFVWMTKKDGVFSKMIAAGIVLFSVVSTILLFDRLRIYDYLINALLIYFLFIKKV